MSAVETGQMSAVETRQMSSAETRQMSTGKTGRCPVSLFTSVLPQQKTSVLSQQQTSVLSQQQTSVLSQHQTSVLSQQKTSVPSQQHIVCVSETSQGSDTCNRDGSRQPYSNLSNRPHPPRQNRGAVLMGIAVWRVTEKPKKTKWQWGSICQIMDKAQNRRQGLRRKP